MLSRNVARFLVAGVLMATAGEVVLAQKAPAPTARRRNANRQARIAKNIEDMYTHRWEVAGGGGFLRIRTGQYLKKSTAVNFWTQAAYSLNPKWAVVGDVRGMYANAKIPNVFAINNVFRPQVSEYTFTAGPQYRFIAHEKYSVTGLVTGGLALSKFGGDTKGLKSTTVGLWPDSNARPVFTVNVTGDYNLYNNLALRVQPTYVATTFGDTLQNNLGVNFGVVYRFGRRK